MFVSLVSDRSEETLEDYKRVKKLPSNEELIFESDPDFEIKPVTPTKTSKFQNFKEKLKNLEEIRLFKKKPRSPDGKPRMNVSIDDAFVLSTIEKVEKEEKHQTTSNDKLQEEKVNSYGISGIKDVGITLPSRSNSEIDYLSTHYAETETIDSLERKSTEFDIFSTNDSKYASKIDFYTNNDSLYSFSNEQEDFSDVVIPESARTKIKE